MIVSNKLSRPVLRGGEIRTDASWWTLVPVAVVGIILVVACVIVVF